jgi:hypothetical protein
MVPIWITNSVEVGTTEWKLNPQCMGFIANDWLGIPCAMAGTVDSMYTTAPCLDFTCTEHFVGDVRIIGV